METALRGAMFDGGMMADENAKLGAAYLKSTREVNASGGVESNGFDASSALMSKWVGCRFHRDSTFCLLGEIYFQDQCEHWVKFICGSEF